MAWSQGGIVVFLCLGRLFSGKLARNREERSPDRHLPLSAEADEMSDIRCWPLLPRRRAEEERNIKHDTAGDV